MTAQAQQRGNVVIVDFGPQAKTRPALVVQNDRDNARMTNTIVVQITSNVSRSQEQTQYLIDVSHADWKRSGLLRPVSGQLLQSRLCAPSTRGARDRLADLGHHVPNRRMP